MNQERLHHTFLDLVFTPGAEAVFAQDPSTFCGERGLDARDQAAFARNQKGLRVYRALIRSSVLDPIPECFPILRALLEREGVWQECLEAFFTSRSVQSPYYRDVNPTFLAWLADSAWGQDRWPFLLQLAHWEYLELECLLFPETVPVSGMKTTPAPSHRALFDGAFRNLAYSYRVHEADEDDPEPVLGPALLVCLRNPEGHFETREVGGPTSAFLARALEGEPLGKAARGVGLPWNEALALLQDFRMRGGILGFQD